MAEYPPLPRVPDLAQPAHVCVAWVIAAEHDETIDALRGFGVWYWPAIGELTTGCTCRERADWYPGQPAAPNCPVHAHPAPPQPCRCRYGVRKVDGVPGMYPLDPFGHYTRERGVYAFHIHPKCPHHGDAAAWAFYEQYADGMNRLVDLVLDENEKGLG